MFVGIAFYLRLAFCWSFLIGVATSKEYVDQHVCSSGSEETIGTRDGIRGDVGSTYRCALFDDLTVAGNSDGTFVPNPHYIPPPCIG